MMIVLGAVFGFIGWFVARCILMGFFTVNQNERAVKTSFGRAQRMGAATTLQDPIAESLVAEERERYCYPQLRVIPPGGPYFKWPWEAFYKVSVATQIVNMAVDPDDSTANSNGTVLEAVTKDQLNTGLKGQIRYRISEKNLYACVFGVKKPIVHVGGADITLVPANSPLLQQLLAARETVKTIKS
jgi:regulator of protease activity HflC (stomatin/prohibitin superfamily)